MSTHVYTNVYTHACKHVYMSTRMSAHMSTHMSTHMPTHMSTDSETQSPQATPGDVPSTCAETCGMGSVAETWYKSDGSQNPIAADTCHACMNASVAWRHGGMAAWRQCLLHVCNEACAVIVGSAAGLIDEHTGVLEQQITN